MNGDNDNLKLDHRDVQLIGGDPRNRNRNLNRNLPIFMAPVHDFTIEEALREKGLSSVAEGVC
jgi:hypothetical protein